MAWDCFMQDIHCQKSQVKILETLKGQHCPEEFCGFFTTLDTLIKAYFHMVPELLEGINQNDCGEDLNLGSDGDPMKTLHEFLWTLMDGASVYTEENWANIIQHFIWFKALRHDGNFYESTDFTLDLAKLKYFVNGTCLIHALWYQKDSDVPQLQSVHQEVLALGCATTFNMLFEDQKYVSSLAWNQQWEQKVFLDPDFGWITVRQETLYLARFCQGIQTLLEWVEKKYLLLTQGHTMLEGLPAHIADDMTNSIHGHSLISDKQFDSLQLELFMVDQQGCLAWDILAVKDILRHMGKGQEVILLSGYSKTSHIADRDLCTPTFIHSKFGRWMVEFLAGGLRHAESLLTYVAYGQKAQHEYNIFLITDNGHQINPDKWYAMFTQFNQEYFQCAWDHCTHIDYIHYGTIHGIVPELTNNIIAKHCWISEEWQTFCGLGPGDLQVPICKRRSTMASTSSLNHLGSSSVDVSAISEATLITENLVPLLHDTIAQDVLSSIFHDLQSSSARTVTQSPILTIVHSPVQANLN
ncbi:hypothetical protein BD769DRAFT_1387360 [Suillus cothurnatus]|nr:hypothetical protein BD769DRAFT_1387360 [Suillus cothurnatus]